MKSPSKWLLFVAAVSAFSAAPTVFAQNSIQLFTPVNVRLSQSGAGGGANQVAFNSTTLNLTCASGTPLAVLSSAPNAVPSGSSPNILVDNFINVTNLTTGVGPLNVCGGASPTSTQSCFTTTYQNAANAGSITGVNPDTLVANGGVAPIDISAQLISGTQQLKIDLIDQGGYVTSSTLVLNTNCTSAGVNGPATISGNTIPPGNPTQAQLDQSFPFNPTTNQLVGFELDLTQAQSAGTLAINSAGVNPQVSDTGIEPLAVDPTVVTQPPLVAYPTLVTGTSFATSVCLVHDGELLPSGHAGCKLYTLECTTGTGSAASGAQCPVSSISNEILKDIFDGPTFTLNDIVKPAPNAATFHEGIGFLEAKEGWAGGPCTFDSASGLQNTLCPQNLLTTFTGPGTYTGLARTTHPNSTFISIAQVPEPLTTVTVVDAHAAPVPLGPGNWTNNSNPYIQLSTQPPDLTGTTLPGAATFVPAPIQSITYGVSTGATPPMPGTTDGSDIVLSNPQQCPAPMSGGSSPAPTFTAPPQLLTGLADGTHLVHYVAQDCAGTQELQFLKDLSNVWSTNFYTYPINVDTVPPQVVSGPTLSPAGPYTQGQLVKATYRCTDALSGIIQCGSQTFAAGTADTGTLSGTVPTSSTGAQSFSVTAVDAAGNTVTQSVPYQVNAPTTPVQFSLFSNNVTYPLPPFFSVKIPETGGKAPTGRVTILDGSTPLTSYNLAAQLKGTLIQLLGVPLNAGTHPLSASYSGDTNYASGQSAPVSLQVSPGPVELHLNCSSTKIKLGQTTSCTVAALEVILPVNGTIGYTVTGGTVGTASLGRFGIASIAFKAPAKGSYTLTVTYAAQGNYQAARPATASFTVN